MVFQHLPCVHELLGNALQPTCSQEHWHHLCLDRHCYDWLSLWGLFSSRSYYSMYVSARPMSVSRGPVCILFRSSLFLLCALPSGRPYPCSPSALRFLSGVGSHLDLVVTSIASLWSPRTDLSPLGNSLASPHVPYDSLLFYCIPSSSTMTRTVVLIPTAAVLVPYTYSTQYKVSCRVQVLP